MHKQEAEWIRKEWLRRGDDSCRHPRFAKGIGSRRRFCTSCGQATRPS